MWIKIRPLVTLDTYMYLCNRCNGTLHALAASLRGIIQRCLHLNNLTHKAPYLLVVYLIGTCGVIGVTYYPENAHKNYGLVLYKEQNLLVPDISCNDHIMSELPI